MASAAMVDDGILAPASDLVRWCQRVLREAQLTTLQRSDFETILDAAHKFQQAAKIGLEQIAAGCSSEDTRLIRHQLRNHLNIISGFTRLIVRDLPDNLLLHMAMIRQILATSETLLHRVNAIN